MARRLGIALAGLTLASLLVFSVGCGVKTPPLASSSVAPARVTDIKAHPTAEGIEVTFTVPREDKPSRRVEAVRLYYGYLPLTGDPQCPPCPPRLRRYKAFDLAGPAAGLMEGGRFTFVDQKAPLNKMALYQAVLIDAAGRRSLPSRVARAPWTQPADPPGGVTAISGDKVIWISWNPEPPAKPDKMHGLAGYFVYRKDPGDAEGVYRQLNARPLTKTGLADKTVENGKTYAYRVAKAVRVRGIPVTGRPSPWVKAKPSDAAPPAPPSGLNAASMADGLYLRFTPSPDQDAAGYNIYRREGKTGPWVKINQELVSENTFVDKNVKPQALYQYRVTAVDEAGNVSADSEVLEVIHLP